MGASLNRVEFIGNCGKDPEMMVTAEGTPVTKFSLAVNETRNNKQGNKETTTLWLTIVCWNKTAELAERLIKKGTQLYIAGRLSIRKYDDKSGVERTAVEIICNEFQLLGSSGNREPVAQAVGAQDNRDPFLPDWPDE